MSRNDHKVICCLKRCSTEIQPSAGRTDVRAFDVSKNESSGMEVGWHLGGMATFHRQCWSKLCKANRTKGSSSSSGAAEFSLSSIERQMIDEASKTAEHHDSNEAIQREAERITNLIRSAKYCISFTGAGISTAAGIGDFRGIDGQWTERDKVGEYGSKGAQKSQKKGTSYKSLRPTYTHDAILKLLELGHLKYVISQNCDGLHVLSGIPLDKISELHGNTYMEKCELCDTRYHRSHPVGYGGAVVAPKICSKCHHNHRTGRKCEAQGCNGYLMNTIINFSDNLEAEVLDNAVDNAKKADLVLCLGTTLMVSPANSLVTMGKKPTRLIICNRQVTPYDNVCYEMDSDSMEQYGSRTFGDCDRLMREVMKRMLSQSEFKSWEDGRQERLLSYDLQRTM